MTRFGTIALILLAALPARAQPPATPAVVTEAGLRELHAFSRCVVRGRPARVDAALAVQPTDPVFQTGLRRLIEQASGCTRGRLQGGSALFAGALAEQLVMLKLGGRDLGMVTAYRAGQPPLQARDDLEYMGLCMLRASPAHTAALFVTRPGSPEEAAAVSALQAGMAGCVAQGQQVTLNRAALRATLALASLRLINQNGAPAQASHGN